MVTVQEVLQETEAQIQEEEISSEDKAVLNNIDTLINELRGRGVGGKDFRMYSADELSRIAGSLALLKDSLVEVLTKAGRNKSVQEAVLKLSKGNHRDDIIAELKTKLAKNPTVDDIKAVIEKRIFRARLKLAFLQEFSEKMVYKWRSLNSILDVISNRIHVLQSQGADTKTMDDSLDVDVDAIPQTN